MGISVKPTGKFKSLLKKIENGPKEKKEKKKTTEKSEK